MFIKILLQQSNFLSWDILCHLTALFQQFDKNTKLYQVYIIIVYIEGIVPEGFICIFGQNDPYNLTIMGGASSVNS